MKNEELKGPLFSRRDASASILHSAFCLLHFFLASSCLAAETNAPAPRPVSLQECIEMALKQNLDLQIERINPSVARLDLEIARADYDPNFIFSADHSYTESGNPVVSTNLMALPNLIRRTDSFSSGIGGLGPLGLSYDLSGAVSDSHGSSDGTVGLTLTQPLLRNFLIDDTRFNIAVARNLLRVSELQLRLQIINVLTAVEQAYYELTFARENVKVQAEGLRLAERLFADDQTRVRIGMIPRLDEKQSESQVAARQADLSTAQRALATAQNSLKRLITSNYRGLHDAQLDPTEALAAVPHPFDLHESWGKGLALRPDLSQARLDVERQGVTLKYYRNQRLPALDVTGSYGHGASGATTREFSDSFDDFRTGDKTFWTLGAAVSIPLSNKAARERYRQGKATADQLLLALKRLEETVLVEIDEAVNALRTSLDRVESTRKARIYADEALSAEQKKLESGKSTSFVVLQLQRDLTSARSEEIRALADYNRALAELFRAEGTTLERRKISVEVK